MTKTKILMITDIFGLTWKLWLGRTNKTVIDAVPWDGPSQEVDRRQKDCLWLPNSLGKSQRLADVYKRRSTIRLSSLSRFGFTKGAIEKALRAPKKQKRRT